MPTFPKYDGKLPECLNPFNPIHYWLLAYWVYFRPTALNCYLYQAAPEIYHHRNVRQIFRLWKIRAYRHLYCMTLVAILLFGVLVTWLMIPQEVLAHQNQVNAVTAIPNSEIALSASADGTVRMWDFRYKPSLSILPSNISALLNSNLDKLDNARWRERLIWHSGAKGATAIAVTSSPQKRYVATALTNQTSFDSYLWEIVPYLEKTFNVRIHNRRLSPKIQSIETGTIEVWDWQSGQFLHTLAGHTDVVNAIAIAPNNSIVISASDDKTIKIWDINTGKELRTLIGHTQAVNAIAISSDNSTVISASDDKTIKVWDLNTGQELRTLTGHTQTVNAVAITPNSSTVISASDDKTIKVWDLNAGRELRTLTEHTQAVNAVAITPNSSTVISASDDKTIRVWDLNTGQELRRITGSGEAVELMSVTSHGKKAIYFTTTSTAPQFVDLERGVKIQRVNELLNRLHIPNLEPLLVLVTLASGLSSIPLILAASVATFGIVGAFIGGILGTILLPYASPFWYFFSPIYGAVPSSLSILVKLGFYTRLLPLGLAGGVSSRKALGVVGGILCFTGLFAIFLGVTADVIPISPANPDLFARISVSLAGSVVIAIVYGIFSGIVSILSASRLVFYPVYLPLALASRFGRGRHPVEWDELIVLPLPGTQRIITQRLQQNERQGLNLAAEVAGNPFQRAFAQQALHTYLHQQVAPLRFLYNLLSDLQTYIYPPLRNRDWQRFPTTGQVLLGELGRQWVDCSSGWFNQQAERCVWRLTQGFRHRQPTSLTRFAALLDQLLDPQTVEAEDFNLSAHRQIYSAIALYNDGAEISQSFAALDEFLAYRQISDLPQAVDAISQLTLDFKSGSKNPQTSPHPALSYEEREMEVSFTGEGKGVRASQVANYNRICDDTAIRPAVLTALARLGQVGAEVATYEAATSRVNKLAALARASKNLDDIDKYISAEIVSPEKFLLRRIVRQWQPLVTEASGKFGFWEINQPVANPYVIGNPVTGSVFVGREDIMRRLEELWLAADRCPSVILYGHRRMGKSSILRNLSLRLGANTLIVDFNLQRVGMVTSTGELIYNLALSLYDVLPAEQQMQLREPDAERFLQHNPYTAFDRFLKQIDRLRADQQFIITIDEFELIEQLIAEKYLEARFLDFLRGLIQTYPWFIIAFAGLHTLQEMTQNYWHPLFGSVTAIPVSFISSKASERLLVQPSEDFNLDYDREAIDLIIELTNGQPYLLQLIGHSLVTHFNRQTFEDGIERERKFTSADVEVIINTPEFYRDGNAYFSGIWAQAANSQPAGQTEILQLLSRGSLSLHEIVDRTAMSLSQVRSALEALQRHDVVKPSGDSYVYTVELMRRWVAVKIISPDT
ncbi:MAG: AAA family ATPase [Cyanosarcina radialis HA8281-LM2]|jgi:WD40 repeat protein|nr:AAA family ATPase [Cyanosarcina radialis HA8281-LM2]